METAASSPYLDCYLYIDNEKLTARLYDKQDDSNFPIVNFPFLSSNVPSAPAYGVYVSQLIRYARTCSNYQHFMERGKVLTTKLLSQEYQKTKLVATLKKFYGRHHDLVNPYNVVVSRIVSGVCFFFLFFFFQWRAISRPPKSQTYASTDISFVQAYGHGGRSLLTKYCLLSADAWLHPLFWGPCLLVWTFWFVICLWIYEFGLRLWYHDHNYLCCVDNSTFTLYSGLFLFTGCLPSFTFNLFWRNFSIQCKQYSSWSDPTFCGVWSCSLMFANVPFIGC